MANILKMKAATGDYILNQVDIYFDYKDKDGKDADFRFPIVPEKIDISDQSNNTSLNILSLGEVTVLQKPSLKTISWSSWLPFDTWYPYIKTNDETFKKPAEYVEIIEDIRNNKKVIDLTVTGIGIRCKATIEAFNWYHQGGDTEDKYYDITLKEYQEYGVMVQQTGIVNDTQSTAESQAELQAKNTNPTELCIGANVILNGQLFADSYGGGAGATFNNYACHISLINKEGTKMYHVSDSNGGSLGWVDESSLTLADGTYDGVNDFSSSESSNYTYTGNTKNIPITTVTPNKSNTSYATCMNVAETEKPRKITITSYTNAKELNAIAKSTLLHGGR